MIKFLKEWREKEKFVEMARIGNLPKHNKISIWVNDKGEDREEPHFHIITSDKKVIRLKIKNLVALDKMTLNKMLKKELIEWMYLPNKKEPQLSNIEVALLTWNLQKFNKRKIRLSDLDWYIAEE